MNYGEIQDLEGFPKPNADDWESKANGLFKPYIFVEKKKNTLKMWTSCCGNKDVWECTPRTMRYEETSVLYGRHNQKAVCPFCGEEVTLKETRYLRGGKRLEEYHPVIFVDEKDGRVYARGFWTRKRYETEEDRTAKPALRPCYEYIFEPGRVVNYYYNWNEREEKIVLPGFSPREVVKDSFYDGIQTIPYSVFGAEKINDTFLKWSGWEKYAQGKYTTCLMRFLCIASCYPRTTEMLIKSGFCEIVEDYMLGRKKNSDVLDWNVEKFPDAFGLDKREWNEFCGSGCGGKSIGLYKKLRKKGLNTNFVVLKRLEIEITRQKEFVKICVKRGIKPERVLNYLEKQTGPRGYGAYFGTNNAFFLWKDYLDMAEYLQMDLCEHNVLLPKDLELAHNEAAAEQTRRKEAEKRLLDAQKMAEFVEKLSKWKEKYNFCYGEHFIRVAESEAEILCEGKILRHCVGGYAGRHVEGKTTILFLRRCDAPDTPLYTIEWRDGRLVQIHGYKNELENGKRIAPNPRDTMREMLDLWTDWIKRGSPRDKDGNAKLRKNKKENVA